MREKNPKRSGRSDSRGSGLQFSARNGVIAGVGLVVILVGYYLLAEGSVTLAPLLLVVGYVVFMTLAIVL